MKLEEWGPPIWKFFHFLTFRLKNPDLVTTLFNQIQQLCKYLPCPDCSQHATAFFTRVPPGSIRTIIDLQNLLFVFHNSVNARKKKPIYPADLLAASYSSFDVIREYNNFSRVYNNRSGHNIRLFPNSMQRVFTNKGFRLWLIANYAAFV